MKQKRHNGLRLFTGNRLEILVEQLSVVIKEPVNEIFSKEIIIIQSRGMERYVSMELARKNQIIANCSFPFPNAFLNDIFDRTIQELPENSPFETDQMAFKIMKILPELLEKNEFEHLKIYLKNSQNCLKLFQLSEKIANLFDHYLVYRPEMIIKWEKNQDGDLGKNNWQPMLWRELVGRKPPMHRANLKKLLIKKIRNSKDHLPNIPDRIFIFGISYLPLFHMEIFLELSRVQQVNMFILNPCKEYWFDIFSDREIRKIKKKYFKSRLPEDEYHLEQGNPLLASMGGQGRDFFSLLYEHDCEFIELFEEIQPRDLLTCTQSDILHLRHSQNSHIKEKRIGGKDAPKLYKQDPSIQVHSCHSPLREIEVLYDNLINLFQEDHTILPKDIIVMTTDIEMYAPYIHIVFDTQMDPSLKIPYSIADQSVRKESRIIEGFLTLLSLKSSRWSVSQVMGILEFPDVKAKYDFSDMDMKKLEYWVQDINIRWGIDSVHREEMGLPGFSENTWKAGLERLLLGYAMPGCDKDMYQGILPYDHIEGNDALIFGRFLRFAEAIFYCKVLFESEMKLSQWSRELSLLLNRFFMVNEKTEHDFQLIKEVLHNLIQIEETAQYHENIDISAIQNYLEKKLQERSFGFGFLSGGVTFCAMLPMRSIPFKVVYLIGMNSGAFPRNSHPSGFDLIGLNPRKGDRSKRNDDKYLFLESILSARKKLIFSHVGQDIQDNSKIPPSTLVSELIDHLITEYRISDEQLITEHRLQPFNPDYYKKKSKLYSYSKENMLAARYLERAIEKNPFFTSDLPEPPSEVKKVTIQNFSDFFYHPIQYLCKNRLGIYLEKKTNQLNDSENYILHGLEKYWIEQEILEKCLTGDIQKNEKEIQKAKGILPHGAVGEYAFSQSQMEVDYFANKIKSYQKNENPISLDIELNIGDFTLAGKISNIYSNGLILFHLGKMRPKDLIFTWIHHLILCSVKEQGYDKKTVLLCKDSTWEFKTVLGSQDYLKTLLSHFWQGLMRPFPLFQYTSYEYARQVILNKKSNEDALRAAKNKWDGNDYLSGEKDNPYVSLCFHQLDPFNDQFQMVAYDFYFPLLLHAREIIV